MKVRDVLLRLAEDGWKVTATKGSHRQLENAAKPGKVTVSGKPSDEIPIGTLKSIEKQSGVKF